MYIFVIYMIVFPVIMVVLLNHVKLIMCERFSPCFLYNKTFTVQNCLCIALCKKLSAKNNVNMLFKILYCNFKGKHLDDDNGTI